jgi:hypothetical protein
MVTGGISNNFSHAEQRESNYGQIIVETAATDGNFVF